MLTFTTPPLKASTAHILSFAFSTVYVGSIYVSARSRLSFNPSRSPSPTNGRPREKQKDERWRDDPDVIKARLIAVSAATVGCCVMVYLVLCSVSSATLWDLFIRLGFLPATFDWRSSPWRVVRPHIITPVLFFGPLYVVFLSQALPGQKGWSWEWNVRREIFTWQGLRNVIAAPPTEEIVFRGCTLTVLHLAGVSRTHLIFLSPLPFGLAHVHHAWDVFNRYGRTSEAAVRAFTVTLFQLTYTTLFGCYCSYLFLRTSSIYPPISAHMFCNFMGFPRIQYEMQMFPNRKKSIITAYILGVAVFAYFLSDWTFTDNSFYWSNYLDGHVGIY